MSNKHTLIRRAATVIEQRGWCKGNLAVKKSGLPVRPEDKDADRFCVVGALSKVFQHQKPLPAVFGYILTELHAQVKLEYPDAGEISVSSWQDAEWVDKDMVLELMRNTAERLEAERCLA